MPLTALQGVLALALAASDTTPAHWPGSTIEVRVWIQQRARLSALDGSYTGAARDAFQQWNRVGLPVRFTFTPDSASADVRVTWIHHFEEPVSGRTECMHGPANAITSASTVLALFHQNQKQLSAEEVR